MPVSARAAREQFVGRGGAAVPQAFCRLDLARAEFRLVAIQRRAIGADRLVGAAHIDEFMRVIEGRLRPDAHEFLRARMDHAQPVFVVEMGSAGFCHVSLVRLCPDGGSIAAHHNARWTGRLVRTEKNRAAHRSRAIMAPATTRMTSVVATMLSAWRQPSAAIARTEVPSPRAAIAISSPHCETATRKLRTGS